MKILIREIDETLKGPKKRPAIRAVQVEMMKEALQLAGLPFDIDPEIARGEHGKPYLKDYPDFHYNFSDSGKFVVLGVNHPALAGITPEFPGEIGIDIQKLVTVKAGVDRMAARYYTPDEARFLAQFDNDNEKEALQKRDLFLRLWSIKEAYLKFTGMGLAGGMSSYDIIPEGGHMGQGIIRDRETGKRLASYLLITPPDPDYVMAICTK